MNEQEARQQFLEGLNELTRKTGLNLGTCGCCGSPWLEKTKDPNGRYIMGDKGECVRWSEA